MIIIDNRIKFSLLWWSILKYLSLFIVLSDCIPTVAPRLSKSSSRVMAEEGQNISITCSATGQPKPNITWSKSIGDLPVEAVVSTTELKVNNVQKQDGGVYICKASTKPIATAQ